jgi:hypothetical protein
MEVESEEVCGGMIDTVDSEKEGALCHRGICGQSRAASLLPLLT